VALRSEPTSQSLEKKLLIMGFEVPDVLAIFLLLSILHFVLGPFGSKILLVWCPVIVFALVLRIGKHGKPDNYLLHLVKFHTRPKYLSSFQDPRVTLPPPKTKRQHLYE
jgi:hypothetical protein